ncbi:MAG: hypothetical protein ACK4R6_10065 [Spirosomataceae bacterium]
MIEKTSEFAVAEYLNEVLENGDDNELATAIGHVAKAIRDQIAIYPLSAQQ